MDFAAPDMLQFFRKKSPDAPTELAAFLQRHALEIEGTLCVFGDWFGRPTDNWHKVTGYEVAKGSLKLSFHEGETLEVWRPQGVAKEGGRFEILRADRVRWEWFYYGRPKTPENRFFREHVVKGGAIEVTTNITWAAPSFSPALTEPAVVIQ